MKKFLFIISCFFIFIGSSYAVDNSLSKHAKSAILIEESTGEVLYEYNSDKRLAPASMTNVMITKL